MYTVVQLYLICLTQCIHYRKNINTTDVGQYSDSVSRCNAVEINVTAPTYTMAESG